MNAEALKESFSRRVNVSFSDPEPEIEDEMEDCGDQDLGRIDEAAKLNNFPKGPRSSLRFRK